jgi:hypothetical protein
LATVDYEAVACPRLDVLPGGASEPHAKKLLGRTLPFEPTADTRRLGLLMAWGVLAEVDALLDRHTRVGDQDLLLGLRARLDWRFVLLATGLATPAAAWLALCASEPEFAEREFEPNPLMPASPHTYVFAKFVDEYATLQRAMRGVLQLVRGVPLRTIGGGATANRTASPTPDERRNEQQLLWAVRTTIKQDVAVAALLVRDLNPHLDFVTRVCGLVALDSDPLLPQNVLRWLPTSCNYTFLAK